MIKIENVDVYGWEAAIRGMRNAKNSWNLSDSTFAPDLSIGPADHKLMMTLARGGSTHAKYRRMINVTIDVVAPLYVISEMDTYKVGTVRNSCSFMHKGVSKPFEITDFSVHDNRIYEILSPIAKKEHSLVIPYETDEYKIFVGNNGRKYRVYRNGRVVAEKFEYIDSFCSGRSRTFPEKEVAPAQGPTGYWYARFGGRNGRIFFLHRLVAMLWVENPNGYETVNHINGNKGDNSAENLEWCSRQENITKGFETGLYENGTSLHCLYIRWKNGHTAIDPLKRARLISEKERGATAGELVAKYDLTKKQVNAIVFGRQNSNAHIFETAYTWEEIVHTLNELREAYLETGDESYFQQIRALLPSGYNQRFTLSLNYEVLAHMYHDRKNHRLDEWREFCEWIKTLPYSELITLEEPYED